MLSAQGVDLRHTPGAAILAIHHVLGDSGFLCLRGPPGQLQAMRGSDGTSAVGERQISSARRAADIFGAVGAAAFLAGCGGAFPRFVGGRLWLGQMGGQIRVASPGLERDQRHLPSCRESRHGVNVMPLAVAPCRVRPRYFQVSPLYCESALRTVQVSQVSRVLLDSHGLATASRIAGAYLRIGMRIEAEQILRDMKTAGFELQPVDPFARQLS